MENNIYSFAKQNANVILKGCFIALETGNEQLFLKRYADYIFWQDYAENWIKGKQ